MTSAFHTEPIDLGHGFSVEFKFADGRMDCAWSPRMPYGRRGRQILPAYWQARHKFLTGVSAALGIAIVVADLGPNSEVGNG